MDLNRKTVAILIALGVCGRLIPHPWNFTPMMAVAFYAGAKSEKLRLAILVTVLTLLISDAILGFYSGMWYVYAASLVPIFFGRFLARGNEVGSIAAAAICSSLSFFVLTNFAVWAVGSLYPHTASGLTTCFTAAIPFYRNQVFGDAFYTIALFGGEWLLQRLLQPATRTA